MQFFASSQSPWSNSKQPQPQPLPARGINTPTATRKVDCGWYDSSFDLASGLEVVEEDCDTLYQLWDLSQN